MGTRSVTVFIDNERDTEKPLCAFYQQFDGYPSGYGKDLKDFLIGFTIVNGFSGDEGKIANGTSCLAAQVIKHFKEGVGGLYMTSIDDRQEYNYTITGKSGTPIRLRVEGHKKILFDGTVDEFNPDMEESEE